MVLMAELLETNDWKDFKNKNGVAMFSKPSEGKLDIYMRTMTVATDVSLFHFTILKLIEIQYTHVP